MNTLREAAQQALEALQAYGSHAPNCDHLMLLTSLPPQRKPCSCGLADNITALRAALAEPVQAMTRKELDTLWFQAKRQSIEESERFVRYNFAALVAAAEREACAKVCEEKKSKYEERASKPDNARDIDPEVARIAKMTCDFNAAAIRARGET